MGSGECEVVGELGSWLAGWPPFFFLLLAQLGVTFEAMYLARQLPPTCWVLEWSC